MSPPPSFPSNVSNWLQRWVGQATWKAKVATVAVVLGYLVFFSQLPPRLGWALEAVFGGALVTLYCWPRREEPWFGRAVVLNGFVTGVCFGQYGAVPFDDRYPVLLLTIVGWSLGMAAMWGVHRPPPESRANRQTEIVLLGFATALLIGGFSIYQLSAERIEARKEVLIVRGVYRTPRAAEAIERCLGQTQVQRKKGRATGRFDYDPKHPDERQFFDTLHDVRWTVRVDGADSVITVETPDGSALPETIDALAKHCGTPD